MSRRLTLLLFFELSSLSFAGRCRKSLIELLVIRGTPDKNKVIGFHGTSVEALKMAATTGKLSTGTEPAGFIYIVPNPESPQLIKNAPKLFGKELIETSGDSYPEGMKSPREAFAHAKSYASTHGNMELFRKRLNLKATDWSRLNDLWHALSINGNNAELSKLGMSAVEQREWCSIAMGGKSIPDEEISVVISFDPKVLKDFKVELADDMRIVAPEGIPIEYISGIEVISQYGSTAYKSFDEWLVSLRTPAQP